MLLGKCSGASMGPRFGSAEGGITEIDAVLTIELQWGRALGARRAGTYKDNHDDAKALQWGRALGARRAADSNEVKRCNSRFNGAALWERGGRPRRARDLS